MLVSHKFKFIFIKTRKIAGTSIEVDLSKLMGAEDIVTDVFPEEVGHIPRNYVLNNSKIYNHMSAVEVRKIVGDKLFREYFKFCVEREPVDKCISHYSMLKNSPFHNATKSELSWDQYVRDGFFPVDDDKYTDKDGVLLVDKIIRYEDLNSELCSIMQFLGVPFTGLQARAKGIFRDKSTLVDVVPFYQRKLIYSAFANSLKFTGYSL